MTNLESLLDKSNEKIANYEVNETINREMNAEQNEKAEEVKIALSKIGSLRRSLIDLLTVEKIKKFKSKNFKINKTLLTRRTI